MFKTTVYRYLNITSPIEAVWNWMSQVENWNTVADAFAGATDSFRHTLQYDATPTGQKMRVVMANASGKKQMIWAVTQWKPKEEITMQTHQPGLWTGFRAVASFKMETLITSQTRISLTIEIAFNNPLVAIITFVLPMQWVYGRALNRGLQSIQTAIA